MNWMHRISELPPEHRKLLLRKLAEKKIDILQLPIPGQDRSKHQRFPLSVGQERLWLIHQLDPGNFAYNIISVVRLEGNLDGPAMEQGINEIVRRHETLRTIFIFDNDKPAQIILPGLDIPLKVIDFKSLPPGQQERKVDEFILADSRQPFNLVQGPLLRTSLLQLNEKTHIFLLVIHHIISDGTSVPIFIRELVRLYDAFSRDKPSPLPGLPIQYADYVCWQRQWFGDRTFDIGIMKKQEAYWLDQFSGEIPVQPMATDYPVPLIKSFEGDRLSFVVESNETRALKEMALKESASLYIVLLALYNMFLSRLSGTDDIVVVSPVTGRRHPALQDMIGMFVNMLALRNFPHPDKTFREFLGQVRARTLRAFENQEYRYEDIMEKLNVLELPYSMILDDVKRSSINLQGLRSIPLEGYNQTAKFNLALSAREEGGQLEITFEYCVKLFRKNTIQRYGQYFIQLLRSVLPHINIKIYEIDIIPPKEKARILYEFNRTRTGYPQHKSIGQLFADQVEVSPDNTAVVFEDTQLTYRKLKSQVNQWARLLIIKGVQPDTIVPIMLERSLEMVVGILGILTAGGAYLPIDTRYPQERIKYILDDCGARIILASPGFQLKTKTDKKPVELISLSTYTSAFTPVSTSTSTSTPGALAVNLAYVIYTSGSTGKPKGVLIDQIGVVNMVYSHRKVFNENIGIRISQVLSPAFDAFASEFLPCLLSGSSLYIASHDIRMNARLMKEWLIKNQINMSFQSTIMGEQLLKEDWPMHGTALRVLGVGGDQLTIYPVKPYPFKLYNLYGPTEDTVWTTWKLVDIESEANQLPPIGKPLYNHQVYILGTALELKPLGVVGELCISGDGLARGYLNNPGLTFERFIKIEVNSQVKDEVEEEDETNKKVPGKKNYMSHLSYMSYRLYKTGDLAKWLPDGNIEFLGRKDHQVKIRGFRIELGEIESKLLAHDKIKDVVVVIKIDKSGDKCLCAYLVTDKESSISEFKVFLSEKLPYYMIPAHFIFLDHIPLTPNGKVDRKVLPEPEIPIGKEYIAPRDKLEEKLVKIWSEALGIEPEFIGIDMDFFQLGGQSLKAAVLTAGIHKELQVKISLAELFKAPTVRALARKAAAAGALSFAPILPVEKKEYYPASHAQERVWVLSQVEEASISFNIPMAAVLEGKLTLPAFHRAFEVLVERHESLRTVFTLIAGEPWQQILTPEESGFKVRHTGLAYIHPEGSPSQEEKARELLEQEAAAPFDLTRGPLLKIILIRLAKEKFLFFFNIHHIISDFLSQSILFNEMLTLYDAIAAGQKNPLTPLRIQYKDYTSWHHEQLKGEAMTRHRRYWQNQLKGDLPRLQLPLDKMRPAAQTYNGANVNTAIEEELLTRLRAFSEKQQVTLFMTLLGMVNALFYHYTGQDDIVLGTVIAGREHADLQDQVGYYLNTLALRLCFNARESFLDLLKKVKDVLTGAYQHQAYPFDFLVKERGSSREVNRHPFFDVMLDMVNYHPPTAPTAPTLPGNLPGTHPRTPSQDTHHIRVKAFDLPGRFAKFDLAIYFIEKQHTMMLNFEYNTDLFERKTIERMVKRFKRLMETALTEPGSPVSRWQLEQKPALQGIQAISRGK